MLCISSKLFPSSIPFFTVAISSRESFFPPASSSSTTWASLTFGSSPFSTLAFPTSVTISSFVAPLERDSMTACSSSGFRSRSTMPTISSTVDFTSFWSRAFVARPDSLLPRALTALPMILNPTPNRGAPMAPKAVDAAMSFAFSP